MTTEWYLLYGGASADGRGEGVYKGRTEIKSRAFTFYCEHIKDNPYSTGKVMIVTDTYIKQAKLKDLS